MKLQSLISYLESIAPPSYQESYDNASLIVGNPAMEIKGVLTCLDSTEAIVEEAIQLGCNVIVAHHPIVFKGLKRFNGNNYVERTVMMAIKNDIAIYAIHTNLDNVYFNGVNAKIAEKIGLINTQILAPKKALKKLSITAQDNGKAFEIKEVLEQMPSVQVAIFGRGMGNSNLKMEVICESALQSAVLKIMKEGLNGNFHYDITSIDNKSRNIGSGMIGDLPKGMAEMKFLNYLKEQMQVGCVRYTNLLGENIKKVALCGGSGGFLLNAAIAQKADIFITADYKYHEFFDADGRIIIADIGHFESEQFTINLLYDLISQKFSNFATHFTKVKTNPVNYL